MTPEPTDRLNTRHRTGSSEMQRKRSIGGFAGVATALALAGCAVIIERPTNGSTVAAVSAPATVAMRSLFARPTSFRAWVAPLEGDGPVKTPGAWREVTNDFTLMPQGSDVVATGVLALPVGGHRLRAVACWYLGTNPSPYIPFNCQEKQVDMQAIAAQLAIVSPVLSLAAGGTATVSVTAMPPPGKDIVVTVASPLSSGVTLTIPIDTAGAVTSAPITATTAGASTLTASAAVPYGAASAPITVRPVLSSLTPTSGTPATQVTVTGAGFVAPMTVRFGTAPVATTPTSATQARAAVPSGLAAGTVQVTVQSANQTGSASLPFMVLAPPPAPGTLLFRSHAGGVETIRFTPAAAGVPASFGLVTTASVPALSAGLPVVGLVRSGNTLLRASSSALEVFTIGGTLAAPTLVAAGSTPATGTNSAAMSGNGVDAAFLNGQFVRGTDRGLEVYQPGTSPLVKLASVLNRPAAMSAGISLLAHAPGSVLLRSTSGSLELWNMSIPPTVTHNNNSVFTAPVGSGLAWLNPGQRLVRGFSSGIQVLDLSSTQTSVTGANNTGGAPPLQTVLALPNGRIARSTGQNLEVYDLGFGANPVPCATSNAGFTSSTGTALAVDGTMLFRATATGIEAWDLSALACTATPLSGSLPAPVQFTAGLGAATTGIGLAGPN